MNEIKEWDVVICPGHGRRLVGLVKRPKDRRPNVCTELIMKEIISSEIISPSMNLHGELQEGYLILTRSGSVYTLSGERKRRDWKTTGLLSVDGVEHRAFQDSRRSKNESRD